MNDMRPNGTRHAVPLAVERGPGWPAQGFGEDNALSAGDLLRTVWQRFWVVVLAVVLLTGAAVGASFLQTPQYEGSIKILVGQERGITATPTEVQGLQQITLSMAELIQTRTVADAVIREFDMQITSEDFLENMSAEPLGETQVIEVTYRDSNPQRASEIANTIGEEFSRQISDVSSETNAITASSWEQAVVEDTPVSPNPLRNGALALALALMIGIGLAFLLDNLDDRWRSPEEAEHISGVPTFGVIREYKFPKGT